MKYEAEIDGRQVNIEFDQRDQSVSAMVDGRNYKLDVLCPERGVYLIFAGERIYEARAWSSEPGSLAVELRGRVFSARVIDRKHRRAVVDHGDEGHQQLVAPMPGKIVRILREPGEEVEAGQGIIVVEAMKMQNEIKSSKAGRVIEVRVAEGDTVNANQVLAVIE